MISKTLSFYTRLFGLWIVLAGVAAYLFPQMFEGLQKFNLYFFALTMFGIGAVLSPEDFLPVVRQPWLILLGTAAQYSIMPFGAYFIARIFQLPDELTAGLTKLLVGARLDVSFWKMFFDLILTVIVPLAAGFAFRHFFGRFTEKVKDVFPAVSVTFIIFICAVVVAANHDRLAEMTSLILLTVVLLNVGGLIGGYALGLLFRLGLAQRRTLSIEIGMQNAGLGTVLAIKNFGPRAAVPTALFVYVCIFTAAILCEFWKRNRARSCQ